MVRVIRHWSWWITLRVMLLIRRMHWLSRVWMWDLAGNKLTCMTAGTFETGGKLFSPWNSLQIMLNTQISQKGSKKSSLNMASIKGISEESVPANVTQTKLTVAINESLNTNLTSSNRNLSFRKSSRLLAIFAFSCRSFIVNSILLSSFGVLWKDIFGKIAIIHLIHSRRICQKPWSPWNWRLSTVGSTACTGGWRLTDQDLAQLMHRPMSRSSVWQNTSLTDAFQRLLPTHLIRRARPGRRRQICGYFKLYLAQFFSKK